MRTWLLCLTLVDEVSLCLSALTCRKRDTAYSKINTQSRRERGLAREVEKREEREGVEGRSKVDEFNERARSHWKERGREEDGGKCKYLTPLLLKCGDGERLVSLVVPVCVFICVLIRAFICICLSCPCVALTEGWLYHLCVCM